jgi:L-ascorbate metabolism protein UlaG (beta-lactamase superfamily)
VVLEEVDKLKHVPPALQWRDMKGLACLLMLGMGLFGQSKRPVEEFSTKAGVVRITPVRHASLMIEAGGQVVHVDPTSQGNYEGLPPADLILITHTHGDHLDPKLLPKLRKTGTVIIAPESVVKTVGDATIIREGQSRDFGKWRIEAVAAYNVQRMRAPGLPYHEKGEGVGFVLNYGGKRFYISGDTEGVPEMRALKNIDVAFVCMNLPYTMPPEEAAEAVRAFAPKIVYPYHCLKSNLSAFEKALAGTKIEVRIRDWYY